jgi:UDP-N-acetyl-2-amino-2-deoxyglucuronate dehydrogenase
MATPPALGFGIVGCGMIAGFHAKALSEASGARLVGVAERSADKARRFAEKNGIPFWTTSVEELAARPDVQAVCVTTPSGAHLDAALAVARAGKHLVIEKPLEITVERIDQILAAADAAGIRIAAIFQARFGPGARSLKAAIEAGRFGRIVLASAYVKWHRKPEYYKGSWHGTLALDGGGALMNQGIHAIDLLQWFAGMPEEVFAYKTRRVHTAIEAEDTAVASLRFPDGGLGSIEGTTAAYPGFKRRIEICGENGSAVLEDDHLVRWEFREPREGDAEIMAEAGRSEGLQSGAAAPDRIGYQGHLLQLQDFIDSIRENRPPFVDGRESRKAVALIRAIYASADSGAPVRIPPEKT